MAHNLVSANGKTAFYYLRPDGEGWHKLGNAVDKIDASVLMADPSFAGLVRKVPYYIRLSDGTYAVSGYANAVVDAKGTELASASLDYEVFQAAEVISFVEEVCFETGLQMKTAGMLAGGRRMWIMTTAPDGFVIGDSDEHMKYIGFMNSHDGTLNFCAYGGCIRIVCENTLNMSVEYGERKKTSVFSIRHTRNMRDSVLETKIAIVKMMKKFKRMQEVSQALSTFPVSDYLATSVLKSAVNDILVPNKNLTKKDREDLGIDLDAVIDYTMQIPERVREKRETTLDLALTLWEEEQNRSAKRYKETDNAYLLYQALSDIVERTGAYRGNEDEQRGKRFMDQMLGGRADQKIELFDMVVDSTIAQYPAQYGHLLAA